jgi:hypothetical protein
MYYAREGSPLGIGDSDSDRSFKGDKLPAFLSWFTGDYRAEGIDEYLAERREAIRRQLEGEQGDLRDTGDSEIPTSAK